MSCNSIVCCLSPVAFTPLCPYTVKPSIKSISGFLKVFYRLKWFWRCQVLIQVIIDFHSYLFCFFIIHPVERMTAGHIFKYFVVEIGLTFSLQRVNQMFDFKYINIFVVCICMNEKRCVLVFIGLPGRRSFPVFCNILISRLTYGSLL